MVIRAWLDIISVESLALCYKNNAFFFFLLWFGFCFVFQWLFLNLSLTWPLRAYDGCSHLFWCPFFHMVSRPSHFCGFHSTALARSQLVSALLELWLLGGPRYAHFLNGHIPIHSLDISYMQTDRKFMSPDQSPNLNYKHQYLTAVLTFLLRYLTDILNQT